MDDRDWRGMIDEFGPLVGLAGIFSFMLWIRTLTVPRVITSEAVYYSGNDPWYHSRMVRLIVNHFPATLRFDPWSRFPYGTGRHSGFGGLFDQLIALAAIILGGGNPSSHFIEVVTAYAPALFGAMTVLVVYGILTYLSSRVGGLLGAGILALLGGQFLSRTVVGSADHQSAEAFFGALAVFGFLFAMNISYTEKPMVADVIDRNWIVLRRPVIASLLGGVALASYLLLWPPGVMLGFTLGIFVVIQSIRDYLEGTPTDYLLFGTILAFSLVFVLTLGYAKEFGLTATGFSLLQPVVFLGIAVGSVVLYLIGWFIETNDYQRQNFPIFVIVGITGVLGLMAVVFPTGIGLLQNLIVRVYSFGLLTSASALTVAEIQPADLSAAWRAFGALFYVAIFGALVILARIVRENRPGELLILLWSVTMFSAYFTSIRFGYYVAVSVAILAGFAIWWTAINLLNLSAQFDSLSDIEAYQVIGVLVILIAVIPGNVVAVNDREPVWKTAEQFGGTNTAWHNELEWVNENTPDIPLDYNGRFSRPVDGDFQYPPGSYGIMSWWDYGHWITVTGQRIPFANPFQEGPNVASAYLQATNETKANLLLEAIPSFNESDRDVYDLSNEDLKSILASQSEQEAKEDIRYVMIDDQMMGGKFGAIATWTGPGYSTYISTQEFRIEGTRTSAQLQGVNPRYHGMIMTRLYFHDAQGLAHYRLVHETESLTTFVSVAQQTRQGWQSTGFINRRLSNRLFTLVQQRQDLAFYDVRQASKVKTFERVTGAHLVGQVDVQNETTVTATLQLQSNTGRNFTYIRQIKTDRDGRFNMTVAYPTNNNVAPADGGTNSGITALTSYRITVGNPIRPMAAGNTTVSESAIYNGEAIDIVLHETADANSSVTVGQ